MSALPRLGLNRSRAYAAVDANGCMTSKTDGTNTWTYTWDDDNRLTRVQGPGGVDVVYQYDLYGRMLTRTSGGTTLSLTWDGWNCVKETDGTNVFRWYCPQGELFSFERNSTFYQVHLDALSNVRAVSDSSGAVVGSYTYGPWGETLSASEPSGFTMPWKFVGGSGVRHDPTTGLHYMRNRWYDAGLARFLSCDPFEKTGRYKYCNNSPLDFLDPHGLEPQGPRGPVVIAPPVVVQTSTAITPVGVVQINTGGQYASPANTYASGVYQGGAVPVLLPSGQSVGVTPSQVYPIEGGVEVQGYPGGPIATGAGVVVVGNDILPYINGNFYTPVVLPGRIVGPGGGVSTSGSGRTLAHKKRHRPAPKTPHQVLTGLMGSRCDLMYDECVKRAKELSKTWGEYMRRRKQCGEWYDLCQDEADNCRDFEWPF